MTKMKLGFLILLVSMSAFADQMIEIGRGVRQNTTLSTFDSYSMVHFAANDARVLSPDVARTLDLTMIADFGMFFTKERMVEALEQSLSANMANDEFQSYTNEIDRFKKALLALPIKSGSRLQFNHIPGEGLRILMKKGSLEKEVFASADSNFSLKIFSIWLGKAHPKANNLESLEKLISDLWKNAR